MWWQFVRLAFAGIALLWWFRNRPEATVLIEQWRRHYNEVRPHSSLRNLTPMEFKAQITIKSVQGEERTSTQGALLQ